MSESREWMSFSPIKHLTSHDDHVIYFFFSETITQVIGRNAWKFLKSKTFLLKHTNVVFWENECFNVCCCAMCVLHACSRTVWCLLPGLTDEHPDFKARRLPVPWSGLHAPHCRCPGWPPAAAASELPLDVAGMEADSSMDRSDSLLFWLHLMLNIT